MSGKGNNVETLFKVLGRDGIEYCVLSHPDGTYEITQDGAVVRRCGTDLKGCLKEVQRLAGMGHAE